ncbi:MAG TPA: GNAT family N-acetyltransferase [Sphingomicrobium sp.]|nr:GNAT family N-acetyltransferase [Sphingomicrobium sp.]
MSTKPKLATYRIEPGDARDLDQVIHVMQSAFDPAFGEAWTRSQCGGILPLSGVALYVARSPDGEGMIGFSLQRVIADEAELLLLAVAPSWRGRGIGRALLGQFVDDARDRGAHRLHLEVRDGNPAVQMYRLAGFDLAGRRSKYYHGNGNQLFDALTFVRNI